MQPPDPVLTALQACGTQVLAARNGHGRRWAVERCRAALVAAGTPPAIATSCAAAMRDVALYINRPAQHHQAPGGPKQEATHACE